MASLQVKDVSTWKPATPWIKDVSTWKKPKAVFVNDAGTWKQVWADAPTFSLPPGTYSGSNSFTIVASAPVVWTYTQTFQDAPGGHAVSPASGSTGTTYTQTDNGHYISKFDTWNDSSSTYAVTATYNGTVVGNWTISTHGSNGL